MEQQKTVIDRFADGNLDLPTCFWLFGVVGLIFDGRNRPIALSKESDKRINSLLNWSQAVDEYPKGELF